MMIILTIFLKKSDQIRSSWQDDKLVIEIYSILSKDPIALCLLNGVGNPAVKNYEQDERILKITPDGGTPTVRVLKRIINKKAHVMRDKNLIIYITTDRQPTDDAGNGNFQQLDDLIVKLMNKYPKLYITFMACVGTEELLKNMNKLGKKYAHIGVVDEYKVEEREMEKYKGDKFYVHNG